MMKRTLTSLLIGLSLLMGATTSAWAQDFQKGWAEFKRGDFSTALREFLPLAEQGDARSQGIIGFMHEHGMGITKDYKEAVKWYRLAAEQGLAVSQNNLGVIYGSGSGVVQDYVRAHMWLNIASANGSTNSSEAREFIAKSMTAADISKAQQLARECVAKNYKGC